MNAEQTIAIKVLDWLSSNLFLKAGAARHPDVLPAVVKIVDTELRDERVTMAKFCEWWANHVHETHAAPPDAAPFAPRGFWHCQHHVCLSMLGTILELMRGERLHPPKATDAPPA